MIHLFKKSLLVLGFAFVSFALVSARSISECKTQLREIAQTLINQSVYNPKINSFITKSSIISEEELIELCDQVLLYGKELGTKTGDVEAIKDDVIKYLRSFVATGMDIGEVDSNVAFFYDEQDPNFLVEFVNPAGEVKTRKYELKIWSWGLKIEFAIKSFGIAIIGNSFNYYDTNKRFDLGGGIDFGLVIPRFPLVGCSFVITKIQETGCSLFLVGIGIGAVGGISYVFGGKMIPVKE